MMKRTPRILNAEPEGYSPRAEEILLSIGQVERGPLSRKELIGCIRDYDVLIVRLGHLIDREVLKNPGPLSVIVTATTGLDHIDTALAQEKGIQVLSLRNETAFLEDIWATAEHAFALLLSLARNIPSAVHSVLQGRWDRDRFRGVELNGKRLGILGYGRIGRKMAGYGRSFGMEAGFFDPGWTGTDPDSPVIQFADLGPFLAFSQILTIHVPLNEETRGMLGEEELRCLPKGAFLVNTSRGGIVEERALLQVLESGHLAGAALDVLETEKVRGFLREDRLAAYARENSNLILTPHIGGATHESMEKTEIFMARKLKTFLGEKGLPQSADKGSKL
jgi:D-3-phosphoglycerate dehydrogenase